MENKNQQSKEFMRAFAKEMQTQEIDLGSDKAKDHKKRKKRQKDRYHISGIHDCHSVHLFAPTG